VHLDGRLAKFSGQHAPHLQTPEGMSFGHDKYVLDACLAEWKRRFVRGLEEWRTGVLFRSLEVAFQAARLPGIGSRTPTMHDIGVNLALWVSALEILCHPPHENVGRDEVLDVLRRVEWDNQELAAEEYVLHGEKKRKGKNLREKRGNFIQKLCVELYRARNDFLHGNKVREDRLFLDGRTDFPPLVCCAPLIYRAALTGVLPEPPAPRGPEVRTAADADLLRRLNLGGYEEAVRECQKLTRSPNE
jgi:hypothetical protein